MRKRSLSHQHGYEAADLGTSIVSRGGRLHEPDAKAGIPRNPFDVVF
jgi:hypothetical protein